MRYVLVLIACCSLFFVQCNTKVDVQPIGAFDTLGIHWMTIDRTNVSYYFQGTGTKAASIFSDLHEEAYSKLNTVFNAKMPVKLRLFVWSNADQAEQILGYPLGFTVPSQCACFIRPSQTLGHEMTHALSYWSQGGTIPVRTTRMVNEGVAVAFDLRDADRIEEAKSALVGQNIKSITDLWNGFYQTGDEEVFYPVAGAFMDYMYKQGDNAKFFALLKDQTFESAQTIYGKDKLDALISGFNAQVGL